MRVVLDTNVLISALWFGGQTQKLWKLVESGKIENVVSPPILRELAEALLSKIGLPLSDVEKLVSAVKDISFLVRPKRRVWVIRTKETDNRILECALEAKVDVLVTGNMKHIRRLGQFRGIPILTPREFVDQYGE